MTIINEFDDGSKIVQTLGVKITANKSGAISSFSDWSRLNDLLQSGIIVKDEWPGDGTYGHDTYRLRGQSHDRRRTRHPS